MATITITITDLDNFQVQVTTDAERPRVGRSTTPAEALAMELLGTSFRRQADVVYDAARIPTVKLTRDLLHPEAYGWAVPVEIHRHARRALGIGPADSALLLPGMANQPQPEART